MTNRTERGLAMVEFALVLPFLALLIMATIDMGRVYALQHRLANAAREGAVYGQFFPARVTNSGSCVDPENIPYHALQEDNGSASSFTITVTNLTTSGTVTGCTLEGVSGSIMPGTRLKVTASASFTALTPFAKQFIGSPATIKQSTEVVVQG